MYCKLFASLYQGTLRGRAHEILVFTNLLACCDPGGYVDKTPISIAQEVGLSEIDVEIALRELESPDPKSRSRELDGARIERIDAHRDWGWRVVNYVKYRNIKDMAQRQESNRNRQAAYRERQRNAGVTPRNAPLPPVASNNHREMEMKRQRKQDTNTASDDAARIYDAYPRKAARPDALRAIEKALKKIPAADLLAKTEAFSEAYRSSGNDPQYIPHPATWFNRDGWNDPLPAPFSPRNDKDPKPFQSRMREFEVQEEIHIPRL